MASVDKTTEKEVKSTILSLLTSNPKVSTIQTVQKDYRDVIGRDIPFYLFKCNSVEHFLKSIPDVCRVTGSGSFAPVHPVINEKISHINELVTKQKVNSKGKQNTFTGRRRRVPDNYFGGPRLNTAKYSTAPSSFRDSSSSAASYNIPSKLPASQNKNVNEISTSEKNSVTKSDINIKQANISNTRLSIDQTNDRQQVTSNSLIDTNQMGGLTQYRTKIGKISPITRLNLNSSNNNNNEIPHNAPIERSGSEEKLSRVDNNYKNIRKLNNLSLDPVKDTEEEGISNVPYRVQANLKMLIGEFPDGIWSTDLPEYYQKQFRKDLSFTDYGYTSLIEMCISLKHIFHYVRPGKDDFKLYDRSKPMPYGADKVYTIASYDIGEKLPNDQALPRLEWSDFRGDIPPDAYAQGNNIPNQFIPEDSKIEDILDVVVVEIYDPSKFWFYLGTSESSTVLDDLMDQLQTFYNNPENAREYAIPPGAVEEGLYCVQIIYGEYHRAKIVRILSDTNEFVRVLYIDYGTVCNAPIKGMCFLRSNFATVPAQAIRGRLTNICPQLKGHPWPRPASDRFRELVNRRDTQIKISYIDWNENYVCVFLADVTDWTNVLYVNETLVKEGHAVWDGEKRISPLLIPNAIYKVQNIHLFPTFLELEYGLAPNASEMYSLAEMLVPLQFCIPKYFESVRQDRTEAEIYDEEFEKCFIRTVKHHRKCSRLNTVDLETVIKDPGIDFGIFGDLKDEMMRFCDEMGLIEDTEQKVQQEEGTLCNQESSMGRDVEDCDPIQLLKLSENIIKKLETYSILDSGLLSSDSKSDAPGDLLTCLFPHESLELDLCKESLVPQNCADDNYYHCLASAIAEKESDDKMSSSVESSIFCPKRSAADVNIFDNPEASEDMSDSSRDSNLPGTPESFLRNIEYKVFDSTYSNNDVCDDNVKKLDNKSVEEFQVNINVKSNLDANKNVFVESLSLTNPFRKYLENDNFTSSINNIHAISSESDITQIPRKKSEDQTSDSDTSDYKFFMPSSSRSDSQMSLCPTPLPAAIDNNRFPTVYSPSSMKQWPYTNQPPTYVPTGFMPYQYPQWSTANDYPAPQWNNMGKYPAPYPSSYPVRPPPGFNGPPLYQSHRPYRPPVPFMTPSMDPAYAYAARPMCYPVPRPMAPPPTAKDFYDWYNEQLMKSKHGGR